MKAIRETQVACEELQEESFSRQQEGLIATRRSLIQLRILHSKSLLQLQEKLFRENTLTFERIGTNPLLS